jgi:DNA-binding NtrC family response regulator
MPDTDGVTLLKEWASTGMLSMPVIMMSGHATIDTAVEATRIGASGFLEKPITLAKLLKAVDQGLNKAVAKVAGVLESVSVVTNSSKPAAADLTVEVAMTGGTLPTPVMDIGPQSLQSFNLEGPLRKTRDEFEKAYFEYHLARESGSMTRVAEKTGLERTHLYRKLRQLGVNLARGKRSAL